MIFTVVVVAVVGIVLVGLAVHLIAVVPPAGLQPADLAVVVLVVGLKSADLAVVVLGLVAVGPARKREYNDQCWVIVYGDLLQMEYPHLV
jgi:hypothetical protein